MTLEQAKYHLDKEYERAKRLEYVKNPLAYALYQVWKKADMKVSVGYVEKQTLTICAVRKIHGEFADEDHKKYIKRQIAVDIAEHLIENGFIRYREETEGDITTILALFNIVDERSENGKF